MSTESLVRVVGVDPGVTTGVASHEVRQGRVGGMWVRRELGPNDHHLHLFNFFARIHPDIIVCERFEYRNVTNRGAEMPGIRLESREYIGVCKLYCQFHTRTQLVLSPTSNKGKNALISPDKLKRLGLYRAPGGRQHMNDATAHALHHIVTKMGRPDYLALLRPANG